MNTRDKIAMNARLPVLTPLGVVLGHVAGWKQASALLQCSAKQEFRTPQGEQRRQLCWVAADEAFARRYSPSYRMAVGD